MMKLIIEKIGTVGQLQRALSNLPQDAILHPFGSSISRLVFNDEENIAYIDEDFEWCEDEIKGEY